MSPKDGTPAVATTICKLRPHHDLRSRCGKGSRQNAKILVRQCPLSHIVGEARNKMESRKAAARSGEFDK
jgi:hypothetical protein